MNLTNKKHYGLSTNSKLIFPDPYYGEPDGLLAVGGDLSVDRLILAYSNGIFPWYAFREKQIQWWCPLKRFVIFPNEIHISHSMRTLMNKGRYGVSFNQAFHEVIQTCGNLRMEEAGAWLGEDIMKAYIRLHEQGFAASVEVWEESYLVGGLYGVTLGKCFLVKVCFLWFLMRRNWRLSIWHKHFKNWEEP